MTPLQLRLIEYVYSRFRLMGEWPLARQIDLDLDDELDPVGGLELVCEQLGAEYISCGSPSTDHDKVMLHLRALELCPAAEDDVHNFLAAIRFCAGRYRESGGSQRDLSAHELGAHLGIDSEGTKRLMELIMFEGRFWQGGSTSGILLSRLAGKLRGVTTVGEYWSRVVAFDERQRSLGRSRYDASQRPIREIFLSHAAADATLATYLANVIRTSVAGVDVFVASAPGGIPTGDEWLTTIRRQLRAADTYLVLLTPTSIERLWIWFETGAAWMSERRLIPVTAGGLKKSEVPQPLGAHQALELDNLADATQLFQDLRIAIADVDKFIAGVQEISSGLDRAHAR
jgi:hypothetical protein